MINADRKVLVLWVLAASMLTRNEIKAGERMPRPAVYTRSGMVYGIAAVVAEFAPDLAFWLALGWTLTIAYQTIGGGNDRTAALIGTPTAPGPAKVPAEASRKGA